MNIEGKKKEGGEKEGEKKEPECNIFHERANHEDMLNMSRFNYFVRANGFLAVAVGLVGEEVIKIVFASVVSILNVLWIIWGIKARKFIRALRNKGEKRQDEIVWENTLGNFEKRHKWLVDPLIMVGIYVPSLLLIGWITILIYLAITSF